MFRVKRRRVHRSIRVQRIKVVPSASRTWSNGDGGANVVTRSADKGSCVGYEVL